MIRSMLHTPRCGVTANRTREEEMDTLRIYRQRYPGMWVTIYRHWVFGVGRTKEEASLFLDESFGVFSNILSSSCTIYPT